MSATASSAPGTADGRTGDLASPWASDAQTSRIQSNPTFIELRRKRDSFGWALSILMLLIYYGFIALVAFVPSVIGVRVTGSFTLGLAMGLGVIVSAVVLTGIYVWRANTVFDGLQAQLLREVGAPARVAR